MARLALISVAILSCCGRSPGRRLSTDSVNDLHFGKVEGDEETDEEFAAMAVADEASDEEEERSRTDSDGEDREQAKAFMSLVLVGANCDNIIRRDGVLAGISKLNCGKFAKGVNTRIFATGRHESEMVIWPRWAEPPTLDSCTLGRFQDQVETVVMEGPESIAKLNSAITAFDGGKGVRIFYLCLPPSVSPQYAAAISSGARANSSDLRLMMEKPIGTDLKTAKVVEEGLRAAGFKDKELYLVDHFLGEPMIDLMTRTAFRGNRSGEIMNSRFFDKRVLILQAESRDLTGRVASFFEGVGQVRDVTQSHLLQMLAVAALPPGPKVDISKAKAHILKKTKCIGDEEGQYNGYLSQLVTEGKARGKDIKLADLTVAYSTYSKMTFNIGTERWNGVPFVVETGKNLDADNWLVRYEAKSGCNLLVNVWGQPEASEKPPPNQESYWLELENPEKCRPEIVAFARRVWKSYGGITRTAQHGWRYKIIPPQGDLPAYANIMNSVAAGSRNQCIDFQQVTAQWKSVESYLDPPTKDVKCYEKCPTYNKADLEAGIERPPCPRLGVCSFCKGEACKITKNATCADVIKR